MAGTGKVVDFQRFRLARIIGDAAQQQRALALQIRSASVERAALAEALRGAQRHLLRISDSYTVLLGRLEREKDFREACQAAAELDDLDEMIRRRDALARQLDDIRRDRGPILPAEGE